MEAIVIDFDDKPNGELTESDKFDYAKRIVEIINTPDSNILFCKLSFEFMRDYNLITGATIKYMQEFHNDLGGNVAKYANIGIIRDASQGTTVKNMNGQGEANRFTAEDSLVLKFEGQKYLVSNNWVSPIKKWNFAKWLFTKAVMSEEEINALREIYNRAERQQPHSDDNEGENGVEVTGTAENIDNDEQPVQPSESPRSTGGKNLIIYGAPGTGKSYWIENSKDNDGNLLYGNNLTRVVFHPEYTYFDFVGQYRPCPLYKNAEGKFVSAEMQNVEGLEPFIDYKFVPGPFTDVLVKAWNDKDNMYTLLLEELNRADAPAVFGDVFQLLDRDKDGNSEYGIVPSADWKAHLKSENVDLSDGKVKIPSNMNIIATMNSADQGVHVLDTAFKRRWDYEFMSIYDGLDELDGITINYIKDGGKWRKYLWVDILNKVNEKLKVIEGLNEDRFIGAFFVKPDKDDNDNFVAFNDESGKDAIEKILFYLWDDVLRNIGREKLFSGIKTMSELYKKFEKGEDVLQISERITPVPDASIEQQEEPDIVTENNNEEQRNDG